jgi:molecular chaperone IbpA
MSSCYKKEKNMTNTLTLRSLDIPSIHKFAVGFDNMFDDLLRTSQANTNYPPYNIVKHGDDNFAIELAVAGFKDGEINIEVERNQLTVKGEQAVDLDNQVEYLHRGISARSFSRTWTLADHVEVAGARSENGILTISLERKVPEEQKPKSIAITYTK